MIWWELVLIVWVTLATPAAVFIGKVLSGAERADVAIVAKADRRGGVAIAAGVAAQRMSRQLPG